MSEVIQLNHQVENTYEFDLEIEGLDAVEVKAWFIISAKGMELSFPCVQSNKHFVCKIPPIPFIERTAYQGAVRIVADDYYFEVVSDLLVNVIGTMSISRSDMSNVKVKSTVNGKVNESAYTNSPTLKDTAISDKTGKPTQKGIDAEKFKTPNTPKPEDSNAGIPKGYDKKTQPTKDELSTADKKNKVIKDVVIKQTKEIAKESYDGQKGERDVKLLNLLKEFTAESQSKSGMARFRRKS